MGKPTWGKLHSMRVRRLRGPYTQAEAAKACGVEITSYQGWERGESAPSAEALRKLLRHTKAWHEALGLDAAKLLQDTLVELAEAEQREEAERRDT